MAEDKPETVVVTTAPVDIPVTPPATITTLGRVTEIVAPSEATHVVTKALDKVLIPNWRFAHRLWSVRLSVFWAIVCGLWVALPAFTNMLPPHYFALVCVGFALLMLFARLSNQPGVVV